MTGTRIIEYHEIGVNDLKIVSLAVYNYEFNLVAVDGFFI